MIESLLRSIFSAPVQLESETLSAFCIICTGTTSMRKAGRTRTDKIGVGISCNFIDRQYTGPKRQSYRDDHRHVGAMPATPSINRPAFSHLYARRGSVVQLSVPR